jgi:UDP-N-acetylmuramoylalanine--D-glutamate ligase
MTPLEPMMNLVREKTDLLILLGEAKERFYRAAKAAGVESIIVVDTFKDAVDAAYAHAKVPQVVLLSPACSSFDMFHDMGERGRYFKTLVHGLEK